MLVLPVALLVLTLPGWSERQETGRVIAHETARLAAKEQRCDVGGARDLAVTMARNLGLDPADVQIALSCGSGAELPAGSEVEADVRVQMPAVRIPGVGECRILGVDGAAPGAGRPLRERPVRARGAAGTITLWLLGLCLLLFALGGISLDLWRAFSERRALAATADAAALSGASAIDELRYRESGDVVLVPALAEALARAGIARQLDHAALRDFEVHANADAVTVVVQGQVDFTLLSLLHPGSFAVRVTATATPRRSS